MSRIRERVGYVTADETRTTEDDDPQGGKSLARCRLGNHRHNQVLTGRRLEARGYLRVEPDPEEGRVRRIYLTDAGRRARDDAVVAVTPLIARLESELGRGTFDALVPRLQRLRAWLDEEREAAGDQQPLP